MTDFYAFADAQPRPKPSAAELRSSIDAALKRLADKHWAQVEAVMVSQGYAPKDGGVIVLPEAERDTAPGHRPVWVTFSPLVTAATLINPRKAGLTP